MRRFSMMAQALTRAAVLMLSIFGTGKGAQAGEFQSLEATIPCAGGPCRESSGALGFADFIREYNLLHKTNGFSPDGKDHRVRQPRAGDGAKYAPIGVMLAKNQIVAEDGSDAKGARSVGFFISLCFALMTAHGMFGTDENPKEGEYSAEILIGVGKGKNPFKYRAIVRPVFARKTAQDKRPILVGGTYTYTYNVSEDWILVHSDYCVGDEVGWMELEPIKIDDAKKLKISMLSFPDNPDAKKNEYTSLWIERNCGVHDTVTERKIQTGWLHSCTTRPGSSGGPLIFEGDDGVPHVFALHARVRGGDFGKTQILPEWDPRDGNEAVDIGHILPKIKDIIEADKREFGKPNPALKGLVKAKGRTTTKDKPQRGAGRSAGIESSSHIEMGESYPETSTG